MFKPPVITQLLHNHVSSETAFVVNDYPYGGLRCKIRYWLEYKPNKGFRFMRQTTNPKRKIDLQPGWSGEYWNKPKASTYSRFGGAMYLDEKGYVQWSGLHEYMDYEEMKQWLNCFNLAVPDVGRLALQRWVKAKEDYEARKQQPSAAALA